jgi:hypothetical protein
MPTDFKLLSGAGKATKPEIVATGRPVVGRGSTDRGSYRGDLTFARVVCEIDLPRGQTSALPALTGRQRLLSFVA